MSFKKWSFGEWFKGNWPTVKESIKLGIPLVTLWIATESFWLTGFGTFLGKFIIDSAHYFAKN